MANVYDMIIVGGGPGGYTAALYAARAGQDVVLLEKLSAGGQMALTSKIDNYPGFPQGIDGFALGMQMQEAAEQYGAVTEYAEVESLNLEGEIKEVRSSEGQFYGRTVVIATGAGPRKLGLPKEESLVGRGVNYCAHCDGMFYKDKVVAVIGGGNSAAADALYLSRIAKKVILIHRRDSLRATKIYHEPLRQAENVEFRWNSAAVELLENGKLSGVRVKNLVSGEEEILELDGIFVSIGRQPASELVRGQLELDEGGYIVADESTESGIPGVFVVGDVRQKQLRQVVTAVADGAAAVHAAEKYLAEIV